MTIEDWLKAACDDADRRGLADLKPLLESLARSMATRLRSTDAEIRTRGRSRRRPSVAASEIEVFTMSWAINCRR